MTQGGWSNANVTRVVIVEGGAYTGLFFYSPDIAAGNLVGSWSVSAGTDPYGNDYPAGIMLKTGPSEIIITPTTAGFPVMEQQWITGNPNIAISAFFQAAGSGLGVAEVDQLLISSAIDSTNGDSGGVVVQSNNQANTNGAKAYLYYESPLHGGQQNYVEVSCAGGVISAGNLTAVEPGTGSSFTNIAQPETWHTAALTAAFTTGGPPDQAPRYQLEGLAGGVASLDGVAYTTAATGANALAFTLPVGYRPKRRKRFVTSTNASGYSAGMSVWTVNTDGTVTLTPTTSGAAQQAALDGITFPVD